MNQQMTEKIETLKKAGINIFPYDEESNRKERLRKIRDRIGFTQQEMANFLEVSISGYSNWENGRRKINNLTWHGILRKLEKV